MRLRGLWGVLVFLVLAGLLTLVSSQNDPPSLPSGPLVVGTNLWPGYEPLYLARAERFFSPQQVRLAEYASVNQSSRALRNGLIDAAALTLDEALLLLQSGLPVTVVLVMDISDGGDALLARPPAKTLVDLKGKVIAPEDNVLGRFMLARALTLYGLKADQFQYQKIPVNGHLEAYRNQKIDGAITFEPVRSQLIAEGARPVFDSRQIPGEILDVLVVHNSLVESQDPRVQALVDGWFLALDRMEKQPIQAARILAQRLKLSPEQVLSSYQGMRLPPNEEVTIMLEPDKGSLRQTMTRLAQLLKDQGLLTQMPDLNDAISQYFVERARNTP
ncbi:MAG: ABC transporter substrate-binding protein [bacterium]|nr:ABC transporter substrate-binding protein [bacterium]